MKIKIFTIHHKKDPGLQVFKKYFTPIQVGAELVDLDLDIMKDNTGDNISFKNKNYAELTASYNVFKIDDFDYIGFMHYRRIFSHKMYSFRFLKNRLIFYTNKYLGFFQKPNIGLREDHSIIIDKISDLDVLSKSLLNFLNNKFDNRIDVIVPIKHKLAYLNLKEQFCLNHSRIHFEIFDDIIIKHYPHFKNIVEIVNESNFIYPYNMFIMKKEYSDEYHEILFDVMFKLENAIDMRIFNNYQNRIFGFLSERFFNYYITYKKSSVLDFNIKELPILFIPDNLLN